MKIQCDVCNKHEASVYCSADEAALCSACDHRVHHANKLAGKHPRFSLLHPPPEHSPVCDICQEKKAFLFCQQDRAILCKDCDSAIHKVNQHKQNHNRFLLTGVKLSPTASLYSSSIPPASEKPGVVPARQQKPVPSPVMNQICVECHQDDSNGSGYGSTTSSISEYLIEMLPGWHVEDFLDPPNYSKLCNHYNTNDLTDGSLTNSFSPESTGIWVPQLPPPARYAHALQQFEPGSTIGFGDQTIHGSALVVAQNDYNSFNKMTSGGKSGRNRISDTGNCFTVPQINTSVTNSKRSRTFWQ